MDFTQIITAAFVFIGGVVTTIFTFKGTAKNAQPSVDKIYTEEVRGLINDLKTSLAEVKSELNELKKELTAKDELIQVLKEENTRLTKEKENYKQWCRDKDVQIEKLKEGRENENSK